MAELIRESELHLPAGHPLLPSGGRIVTRAWDDGRTEEERYDLSGERL
jgi:hypothetical protein